MGSARPTPRPARSRVVLTWLVALCWVFATACAEPDQIDENLGLRVVATTSLLGDLAKPILGDRGTVTTLMGTGVDPHLYQPTRSAASALDSADMVLTHGLHFEAKMSGTFIALRSAGKTIIDLGALLDSNRLLSIPEAPDEFDPHVFMNPELWAETAQLIGTELAKADSTATDADRLGYTTRAETKAATIRSVHEFAQRAFATIPVTQRVLVTAHDAFRYLGAAYGIDVRGIQGISTDSEAGLADVNDVVDLLVSQEIPAIFVESSVPERHVRAVVQGARSRGHDVVMGGLLFSDAMGPANTPTGSYLGMMDHNITTITRALGGTAPATGFTGTLEPVR